MPPTRQRDGLVLPPLELPTTMQAALRLREWAAERGISLPALALQWILRNPQVGVVIAGAVSPAEIEENVRAVTALLPPGWEVMSDEQRAVNRRR